MPRIKKHFIFCKLFCKLFLILIVLLFQGKVLLSQDFSWWNQKHNYDGTKEWADYIIIAPGYMGPNALPVPDGRNGILRNSANLEISYENHFSRGDKTKNIYTEIYTPLYSDRVALQINIVPVEFYKMDTITRDIRRAREYDGEGIANGDFYIGTFIQLIKEVKYLPDVLVSINLKTASGTKLSDARYTDAPAYFFDVSMGKDFKLPWQFVNSIRPYILTGFYCWQTHRDDYFQNDAKMFGLGLLMKFPGIEVDNYWGGYKGYLYDGDRPMIIRTTLNSKFNSKINYKIMYQKGLRDFDYTSVRVGCSIDLSFIDFSKIKSKFQ